MLYDNPAGSTYFYLRPSNEDTKYKLRVSLGREERENVKDQYIGGVTFQTGTRYKINLTISCPHCGATYKWTTFSNGYYYYDMSNFKTYWETSQDYDITNATYGIGEWKDSASDAPETSSTTPKSSYIDNNANYIYVRGRSVDVAYRSFTHIAYYRYSGSVLDKSYSVTYSGGVFHLDQGINLIQHVAGGIDNARVARLEQELADAKNMNKFRTNLENIIGDINTKIDVTANEIYTRGTDQYNNFLELREKIIKGI